MKSFEFWHPRLAEAPYYAALLLRCGALGLAPKNLAKANYALDHGELGLGSKHQTQLAFEQKYFPPTELIDFDLNPTITDTISTFSKHHGQDLILKPDMGSVGKGVLRLDGGQAIATQIPPLQGRYLLQKFSPEPQEYGVFYVRQQGISRITGINRKHFPTVVGDGQTPLGELARRHERSSDHWRIFMKYQDKHRVPEAGESVQLSFIGSHTMGCMFTNDSHLISSTLTDALDAMCRQQPGFNFGRFDIRTHSEEHLQQGKFTVIEVNGIASLPTHMFDPKLSVADAYRIFLLHAKLLVDIANEHRAEPMALDDYAELWRRAKANHATLNHLHQQAMTSADQA